MIDRLAAIEAALVDLKAPSFGRYKARDLLTEGIASRRYKNRAHHAFLMLFHLRDDIARLAKHQNVPTADVINFGKNSAAISLCERAANTHKHGFGGQSRNSTALTSLVIVVKDQHLAETPGDAEALVEDVVLTDPDAGAVSAKAIMESAARDWVVFLKRTFLIDQSDWLARCFPGPSGATVSLNDGHKVVAPGDTVVFDMPKEVERDHTDVVRRIREEK